MNNHPTFDTARELISLGDPGQALQVLIPFLEKDGAQPEALQVLRVVEANYRSAKKQEAKGVISYAEAQREYAKTNDALVSVLDDLIAGRKTSFRVAGTTVDSGQHPLLPWLIGVGIVLAVGILAGIWFSNEPKLQAEPKQVAEDPAPCPMFMKEGFKIMVLEFQKLSGNDSKPELGIQSRIRTLTDRNMVAADVKIHSPKAFQDNTPSIREATALGSRCMADMVIWGDYEKGEDSIIVDIQYAFTAAEWPAGAAIETFKNVSEIKTGSMKLADLDEAVFRLCMAMALHENRLDLAKKWLNKLKEPDTREKGWIKELEGN